MRLFTSILLLVVFKANTVFAMSLDWTGTYRFEYTQIDKPSLGDPSERKSYGLHYLGLSPKIVAADGFNIVAKFDVLNSTDTAYQNSQAGQIWGMGGTAASNTQGTSSVQVSQLYLHAVQEYGSLLVGRAPLQFGVGMTYNAGNNPFDHWYNTRDLAAYKFIIGNFYFMPAMARIRDSDYWQGNVIQEEIFELGYDAPESKAQIALMMNKRKGSDVVNDLGLTATKVGGFSVNRTNLVFSKTWASFAFKLEGSFLQGDSGYETVSGDAVKFNGYGVATEWSFPRKESNWEWGLKAGMATGDNPDTADYEGFHFDRNYDVAFLLFNHRMGREDFLTTNLIKDTSLALSNTIDDEAIGNALYISPTLKYVWNDKIDVLSTFTYAQAMVNPTGASGFNKNLGMELDVDVLYKPRQKVLWSNRLGIFMPGKAFENGTSGYSTETNFGFESRIAVSF